MKDPVETLGTNGDARDLFWDPVFSCRVVRRHQNTVAGGCADTVEMQY